MKVVTTFFIVSFGSFLPSEAAVIVNSLDSTSTIDFTSFTGAGFTPSPSVGQLDSDTWKVIGMSDGDSLFGGTYTTGDLASGSHAGTGTATGGIYAFQVGSGNTALGVQPILEDFTSGSFVLRIQNSTGQMVSFWNLSYDLFVRNDQGRSNSLNWEWSIDDSSYTRIASYTSPELADASPISWAKVQSPSISLLNANVANDGYLYLRWVGDDVGGSGSRDEFAIDNISITAVPEPGVTLLGSLATLMLLRRKRS